jgi:hypothetical protein
MNIVVATDHKLQRKAQQILSTSAAFCRIEADQKERYIAILQGYVAHPGSWFIGEEIEHGSLTFAMDFAHQPNSYSNIDMPRKQRLELGIPLDYANEGGNRRYTAEQVSSWNQQRESFMFEQIGLHQGNTDHMLIVCGAMHAEPLAGLLRANGHAVNIHDIRREEWFIEDWHQAYMKSGEL